MFSLSGSLALISLTGSALAATATYAVQMDHDFFAGPQTGIGSWFRADADQDATNGNSWCGYKYSNSDPIIAVSLRRMGGATYNSDPEKWRHITKKYCGLEAKVTDPQTGKSKLMYIGDGFDEKWVKSPSSIDIMIDAFADIHHHPGNNKNDVIRGVKWELTGRINEQWAAPGADWSVKKMDTGSDPSPDSDSGEYKPAPMTFITSKKPASPTPAPSHEYSPGSDNQKAPMGHPPAKQSNSPPAPTHVPSDEYNPGSDAPKAPMGHPHAKPSNAPPVPTHVPSESTPDQYSGKPSPTPTSGAPPTNAGKDTEGAHDNGSNDANEDTSKDSETPGGSYNPGRENSWPYCKDKAGSKQ
ncbi:hypothetical protein EJ05DRAFT_209161 [Pseudovirgaria hyperparasitica]|uniref:Uncharacterized protein n=1 Tax=Pseudovirgaria hyperparasitica TaxID=470096 RepID=A0A6A6VRP4_9PEZI|nr:uncharacterized protein EJ05DRAFT_209161 [Pseudovirgaria hyperparasitica]KAF2753272.1 hypothetical protein EJ05DRAFT_209161 [Pseudovirgaria hyperparasitica]